MDISIYSNGIIIKGNDLKKSEHKSNIALMKDKQLIALIDVKNYRLLYAAVIPGKCKFYKLVRVSKLKC